MRSPRFTVMALVALSIVGLLAGNASAQLSLSNPTGTIIYQRDDANRANVRIAGTYAGTATAIQAQLVAHGQSAADNWTTIDSAPNGNSFGSYLSTPVGWYDLHVKAVDGSGQVLGSQVVTSVGVGEVFITAGQSNSANTGQAQLTPQDERVLAYTGTGWRHAYDPQPITSGAGSTHAGSVWPAAGDALADALDMPIGFYSVGVSGTCLLSWLPTDFELPQGYRASDAHLKSKSANYGRLTTAITQLKDTGFRGVLWHQGEGEGSVDEITHYGAFLTELIGSTRKVAADVGCVTPEVTWFVAQTSYHTKTVTANPIANDSGSPALRAQQASVTALDQVFAGPNTDLFIGPQTNDWDEWITAAGTPELWDEAYRHIYEHKVADLPDSPYKRLKDLIAASEYQGETIQIYDTHFSEVGQYAVGQAWAASILQEINPVPEPGTLALVGLCAAGLWIAIRRR